MKAAPKLAICSPGVILLARMSMNALITKKSKPRVRMAKGKVITFSSRPKRHIQKADHQDCYQGGGQAHHPEAGNDIRYG